MSNINNHGVPYVRPMWHHPLFCQRQDSEQPRCDDVMKRKRSTHYWPIRRGIHQSPVDFLHKSPVHYNDVIMGAMVFQIASLLIVYSSIYSGADQRKHQSSAPLAFVRGIHRSPVTCMWRYCSDLPNRSRKGGNIQKLCYSSVMAFKFTTFT